jgi:hypothetical protein
MLSFTSKGAVPNEPAVIRKLNTSGTLEVFTLLFLKNSRRTTSTPIIDTFT